MIHLYLADHTLNPKDSERLCKGKFWDSTFIYVREFHSILRRVNHSTVRDQVLLPPTFPPSSYAANAGLQPVWAVQTCKMEDVSETRIQIAELRIFPKGPGGQTGRVQTRQKFNSARRSSRISQLIKSWIHSARCTSTLHKNVPFYEARRRLFT